MTPTSQVKFKHNVAFRVHSSFWVHRHERHCDCCVCVVVLESSWPESFPWSGRDTHVLTSYAPGPGGTTLRECAIRWLVCGSCHADTMANDSHSRTMKLFWNMFSLIFTTPWIQSRGKELHRAQSSLLARTRSPATLACESKSCCLEAAESNFGSQCTALAWGSSTFLCDSRQWGPIFKPGPHRELLSRAAWSFWLATACAGSACGTRQLSQGCSDFIPKFG